MNALLMTSIYQDQLDEGLIWGRGLIWIHESYKHLNQFVFFTCTHKMYGKKNHEGVYRCIYAFGMTIVKKPGQVASTSLTACK